MRQQKWTIPIAAAADRNARRLSSFAAASALLIASSLLSGGARSAQSHELPPPLCFRVLSGDSDIGRHRVRFARDGEVLRAEIAIDLRVSLGPLTLFEYRHRSREIWRGERLVRIETRTMDDGEQFAVSGRLEGKQFMVRGENGRHALPADVVPTSYWLETSMSRAHWLDTQRGVPLALSVERADTENNSRSYMLEGELALTATYGPQGRWQALDFRARDTQVNYRPCEVAETSAQWAFSMQDIPLPATLTRSDHD